MDDFNLVKATAAEMLTQSNRSTQYPLFVVQVDEKRYVNYLDDWEHKERSNYDGVDMADYRKTLCARCRNRYDEKGEVPEKCLSENINGASECDDEAYFYYNIVDAFDLMAGAFFTAKACDDHIKENHYHYNNGRSYGVGAWRNPEMQAVMRTIIKVDGAEVPNYYA